MIAEEYESVVGRPPYLRELVHYLSSEFDYDGALDLAESDWKVAGATFRFGKRKPKDRGEPPAVAPRVTAARVKHPKFGEGEIVEDHGDRVTVQFADARRVLLRKFLEPLEADR